MPPMTPSSARRSGYNGASLPPRTGGGDDDSGGRDGGDGRPDSIPDSIPNYGERLRRARMGLAVAMTPILMLFISFTTVYLIRRVSPSLDPGPIALDVVACQYGGPDPKQHHDRPGAPRNHARSCSRSRPSDSRHLAGR